MLKIPAYEYIDCDNVVVCNRADWDEITRVLSVFYFRSGRRLGEDPGLGTGLGW